MQDQKMSFKEVKDEYKNSDGAVMLYIGNFLGLFALKLTFLNCLISGVFGIPGVIFLLIYTHFLK